MEGGSQVIPGDEDEERDLNHQGESEQINTKVLAEQAIPSS